LDNRSCKKFVLICLQLSNSITGRSWKTSLGNFLTIGMHPKTRASQVRKQSSPAPGGGLAQIGFETAHTKSEQGVMVWFESDIWNDQSIYNNAYDRHDQLKNASYRKPEVSVVREAGLC